MSQKARERKRRERERLEREAREKLGFRGSWEYRAIKWLFKFFIACAFILYAGMGSSLTWTWLQTKYVRMQPPERAVDIAKKELLKPDGDPEILRAWLAMRPSSDGAALRQLLEPYVEWMSGATFVVYSTWMVDQGKMEEAAFWRQYALFRTRYDALRCGSADAPKLITKIMKDFPQHSINEYMQAHPELHTKILRQVLDFDAKHPPLNDPTKFCKAIVAGEEFRNEIKVEMQPRSEWTGIHDTLRGVSYYGILHIEEMKKAGKEGGTPAGRIGSGLQQSLQTPVPPKKKRRP
ncbi:MAG: hypothetical protein EPN97_03710 [Alphaproteobacteria bacterium]|nr:MAG: hypothetical protein EPN97_03710 [Alphaproteobacteria bacterium]